MGILDYLMTGESFVNAINKGDVDKVDRYLQTHPETSRDLKTADKRPLLYALAVKGKTDMLEVFLKHGYDPNVRDRLYGETPLMAAAKEGHIDTMKALIDSRARIHDHDTVSGQTPLMHAAFCGQVNAVKLLLSSGANPDVTDNRANDAFYWASVSGVGMGSSFSEIHKERIEAEITKLLQEASKKYQDSQKASAPVRLFQPKKKKGKKKATKATQTAHAVPRKVS